MFRQITKFFQKADTTPPVSTQELKEALVIINLPSMDFMWLKGALAPLNMFPKGTDEVALASGPFYAFHWNGNSDEEKLHELLTNVFRTKSEPTNGEDPAVDAMWTIQPLN